MPRTLGTKPASTYNVGFSFESSSTAAAAMVEDPDGTIKIVTWVAEGNYLYRKVMAKLSSESPQYLAKAIACCLVILAG